MKYCSHCFAQNAESSKYCHDCGVETIPVQSGNKNELVTLFSGLSRPRVHMIESYLEWAGIPFVLRDEFTNTLYANAVGGIKIMVPASEHFRAREALNAAYIEQEEER